MSNYVLVCHGGIREFSSFSLEDDQEVQYRGNFGAPLGYGTALAIWNAIKSDPTVSDEQLARGIANYHPQDVLQGPGRFSPDLDLSGDDNLFLFIININTGRYARLDGNWHVRLSALVGLLGASGRAFWLNLLCCTQIANSGITPPQGTHLVSRFGDIV